VKTTIAVCSAAIMLVAAVFNARAEIIAGPITNPANGHDYYLLSPNTWTASEAEAESLDGTLAIIKNAEDQKWIFSTFSAYEGTNHNLWIGLHRSFHGGALVWVTGEKLVYANWAGGQPDNAGGIQDFVFMASATRPWGFPAGSWADATDSELVDSIVPNGVVELQGKANKLSLSKAERALIGNWYEGGNIERPCWITATDKILFVISNDKFAARASLSADGTLFVQDFQSGRPMMKDGMPMIESGFGRYGSIPSTIQREMHGEILKDKILWSNGTWWSRKPLEDTIKETKP
jgi:Lectin C-type domain